MKNQITNIKMEHLHPHPENPRKNIGDVTELAESIKKNGIMQNLTVIPIDGQPGEYMLIIGHRRCEAAKLAGLTELPCKIVEGMSEKEQISTMLEENMQRNDLTIYEQAQGFQMMLDLGETEQSIADKTGFSKTTIRHRLQMAKLDQDMLKEKSNDENYQLTLSQLIELEKVKDIETRNKILNEAKDGKEIMWRTKNAVEEANRKEAALELEKKLKALGVNAATEDASTSLYSGKYKTVKSYCLDDALPDKFEEIIAEPEELYYLRNYRYMYVIKKNKKEKKELTEAEKAQKAVQKAKTELNAKAKEMAAIRKEFARNVLEKNVPAAKKVDEALIQKLLWKAMLAGTSYLSATSIKKFFATNGELYKASDEEKLEISKKVEALSVTEQMLIAALDATEGDITDHNGYYNESKGACVVAIYNALKMYGFCYTNNEEESIMNGTHEKYRKRDVA